MNLKKQKYNLKRKLSIVLLVVLLLGTAGYPNTLLAQSTTLGNITNTVSTIGSTGGTIGSLTSQLGGITGNSTLSSLGSNISNLSNVSGLLNNIPGFSQGVGLISNIPGLGSLSNIASNIPGLGSVANYIPSIPGLSAVTSAIPGLGSNVVPTSDERNQQLTNQVVQSLGWASDGSSVSSLEDRMARIRDGIVFSSGESVTGAGTTPFTNEGSASNTPPNEGGTENSNIDLSMTIKCRDAINRVGSGSDISSITDAAAFDVVGGNSLETVRLAAQSREYSQYKNCMEIYLRLIKDPQVITARNLNEANRLNNYIVLYSNAVASLDAKIGEANNRVSTGWKDIAKAALLSMIVRVNQNITTNLINQAMNKYKINDYLKYADAVATQVYSMKYIDQNYQGDEESKMVLRSIIANGGTQEANSLLQVAADRKAQEFLNNICDYNKGAADYGSFQNLKCLAAQATAEASPVYQSGVLLEQAAIARAAGQKSADQELADSQGYAPVRDCYGAASEQQVIDSEWGQAATDLKVAQDTFAVLQRSATVNLGEIEGSNLSPEEKQRLIDAQRAEVQKAQQAASAAQAFYDSVKNKRVSGNIIDICEAISSPSTFIANSLDSFLKQHLDQATQLKSENLPFFARFFTDVASNFLTKVISGAFNNDGGNKRVLKDSGIGMLTGSVAVEEKDIRQLAQDTTVNASAPDTRVYGVYGPVDIFMYPTGGSVNNKTLRLTDRQPYSLTIDFRSLLSQGVTGFELEGINSLSGDISGSGRVSLTPEQIQAGTLTLDTGPAYNSFSISITFYGRVAGSETDKNLGRYTQTFTLVQSSQGVGMLPPPPRPSPVPAETGTGPEESPLETGGGVDTRVQGASIIMPRGQTLLPRG